MLVSLTMTYLSLELQLLSMCDPIVFINPLGYSFAAMFKDFLQKTRNATIVPTYQESGKKGRTIGAPVHVGVSESKRKKWKYTCRYYGVVI